MCEGVRDCKKFGNHCSTPSLSFLSLLLFPCLSLLLPSSLPPSLYHSFSLCSSRRPPVFQSLLLFSFLLFFTASLTIHPLAPFQLHLRLHLLSSLSSLYLLFS